MVLDGWMRQDISRVGRGPDGRMGRSWVYFMGIGIGPTVRHMVAPTSQPSLQRSTIRNRAVCAIYQDNRCARRPRTGSFEMVIFSEELTAES